MQCPKCHAEVKEGAAFCHVCGSKLDTPPVSSPYGESPRTENSKSEEKIDAKTFTDVKSDEVIAGVKSGNLFKRVFAILFSPVKEWEKISKEKSKPALIIFGYLLILGVVAFTVIILGDIIRYFRYGYIDGAYVFRLGIFGVLKLIALVATPVIAAVIINSISKAFQVQRDFGKMLQLTAYSFTPVFVAWTMYLIPVVFIAHLVHVVGLYGILLFLLGFKKVLSIPPQRQVGFFFAAAGILYGVYYVMYWTIHFFQTPFWMGMNINPMPY